MLFKCFSCFRIDSGHGRDEKRVCMNERVGGVKLNEIY